MMHGQTKIKCDFFYNFLSEIFLILRRINIIINLYWASGKVPIILVRLKKLEFYRQILEKCFDISKKH